MLARFKSAPAVRELYQAQTIIDRMSGDWVTGQRGEALLLGGISYMTGIGARANMGKTLILIFLFLMIMKRYMASGLIYDTEMTLQYNRILSLAKEICPELLDKMERSIENFVLTDKTIYSGTNFHNELKLTGADRVKEGSKIKKTTPFSALDGTALEVFIPMLMGMDALSGFEADAVSQFQEKDIGGGDRNMEAMRSAAAKTQMLSEMVTLTAQSGIVALFTAHMGDEHKIDPYAPSTKKLAFLKNGVKFKRVPENFTFLTGNTIVIADMEVLKDRNTKAPLYPRNSGDDFSGDTDLQELTCGNYRNKFGGSGVPYHLVISQREGVKSALTNFNLLRRYNKFGLGGNDRTYFLEIYPEVALTRTTLQSKIDSDPKLVRALEITAALALEHILAPDLPREYLCTAQELYQGVKDKGFCWDRILTQSREYWVFDNYNQPTGYLSVRDLMDMRMGIKTPYWWDELK